MVERRNIALEYAESRSVHNPREYIFMGRIDSESHTLLQQALAEYGIEVDPSFHHILQSKTIVPGGITDKMVTSFDVGYQITSLKSDEGIFLIPDRLIAPWGNRLEFIYWLNYYRNLRLGNVEFLSYKTGEYGAVGFNPCIKGQPIRDDICIKFYNFAYPYSQEAWEENIRQKGKIPSNMKMWKLSGVTGIGSYVAYRYLIGAGIPMPTPHFATSEIFVQDFIDGYTIGELIDNYERLIQEGALTEEQMNKIWDWTEEIIPRLNLIAGQTLNVVRKTYWAPDFVNYDINWGNIMIRKSGLDDPSNNYVLIDPIR